MHPHVPLCNEEKYISQSISYIHPVLTNETQQCEISSYKNLKGITAGMKTRHYEQEGSLYMVHFGKNLSVSILQGPIREASLR
jgi:hypothetical protein